LDTIAVWSQHSMKHRAILDVVPLPSDWRPRK